MEKTAVRLKTGFLSGNVLKIIALVSMTVDHTGLMLFPDIRILRIIGRIAFPIFAYMISEGCTHTKNKLKYFFMIFGTGIVCQIFCFAFDKSLNQCILITFTLSLLIIFSFQYAEKKSNKAWYLLPAAAALFAAFVCIGLKSIVPFKYGFRVDYGFSGVFLPVLIYFGNGKKGKLIMTAAGLVLVSINAAYTQWFSLLALIPLGLYNGERGKVKMKYFFYIYYPAHLGLLYIIENCII